MRVRSLVAGATAVVMATGVAVAAANNDRSRPSDASAATHRAEVVLVDTASGTATLDTETGTWLPRPDGAVVPGAPLLVSVAGGARTTRLHVQDVVTGDATVGAVLRGSFVVNVVSGSGRWAALTEPRSEGATPWLPDGRRVTELVVARVGAAEAEKTFELRGNYEPEAFSTDDETLFLIKHVPAAAPSRYTIRRLDLESGRIAPIARLKLKAPGVMQATGRMQVLAPDESQLYTLYTQQGPNYSHGDAQQHDAGRVHAFVHVLDLSQKWAHCIDLPMPFGTGRATASAVAVAPSGRRLYVTDWTNGVVATINPARVRLMSVHEIALGDRDNATFAAATDEVLYVAGNSEVVALETATMDVIGRWKADGEIVGLHTAPSRSAVYVTTAGRMSLLDTDLTRAIDSWRVSKAAGVTQVFSTEEV